MLKKLLIVGVMAFAVFRLVQIGFTLGGWIRNLWFSTSMVFIIFFGNMFFIWLHSRTRIMQKEERGRYYLVVERERGLPLKAWIYIKLRKIIHM